MNRIRDVLRPFGLTRARSGVVIGAGLVWFGTWRGNDTALCWGVAWLIATGIVIAIGEIRGVWPPLSRSD